MLHVFYVFSNITARMVQPVVEHLALDYENVLVILDRSQSKKSITVPVRIEEGNLHHFENTWPDFFSNWPAIKHNTNRINLLTGRIPYTAYLPSDSGYICQQIIHHQECEKYYLIEEGLASYNPPGATPVVTKPPSLYRKFKSHIRISLQARGKISLPHTMHLIWEKKYSGALGSNDLAFPDFPIPVVNLNCKLFTAKNSNITKILVLDDISIYTKDEQNAYLAAIQQVIASATVKNDRWAYKIHPNCEKWPWLTMAIENIYRDTRENNLEIQRLETEECIEDLGLGANVTTYAFMSSCLFYIHQCGGNVVSLKELLFSTHPTFKKAWRTYIPHDLDRLLTSHPSFSGA